MKIKKIKIFLFFFLTISLIITGKDIIKDKTNIVDLKNGDFGDGKQGWNFWTNNTGEGDFHINNQEGIIKIKKPGLEASSIGLSYPGIKIIQNKIYKVEFEAKADPSIEIISSIHSNEPPWIQYSSGCDRFRLTENMQKYSYIFIMKQITDYNAAFQFQFGGQDKSIVVIDNIVITDMDFDDIKNININKSDGKNNNEKYNIPDIKDITVKARNNPLPLLKVKGNKIIDINGNTVILHGVNIGDLDQLYKENHFNEAFFHKVASWGADVIRIPVTPQNYRQSGKSFIFKLLDNAINWSEKYGMYVIIDWHSIGNPLTKTFLNPAEAFYCTPEEMKDFWKTVAIRYKERPVVAFYEIFNEPSALDWIKPGDTLYWPDWRDFADGMIDVIYKENPNAIPIVGCLWFCNDLSYVAKQPLRNKNIVFSIHSYPGNIKEPFIKYCDEKFGFAAENYPIFITEVGFDPYDKIYPDIYHGDTEFGNKILSYAEKKGISWTAYIFYLNQYYPSPLFSDWDTYKLTVQGAFFKKKIIENK